MNTDNIDIKEIIKQIKEKDLFKIIDWHKVIPEDNKNKHDLDCLVLSKLDSNEKLLNAYFGSLGNSALEKASFFGIQDMVKAMSTENLEFLLVKVQKLQEELKKNIY